MMSGSVTTVTGDIEEIGTMARFIRRVRIPLMVFVLIFAAVRRDNGQALIPPSASLDVQIPSPPTPVKTDGRWQLAYELHITNFRAVDVVLTQVDVFGDDVDGTPLARYADQELATRVARIGARADRSDARMIAAGTRAVVFVWLGLDTAAPLPRGLRHRISYDVTGQAERQIATVGAGVVDVRREPPIVLASPVRGGPWAALYDPSMTGGHRRALFAIDGKARIPARFAIDWVRLGDDGRAFRGNTSNLANFYGYGAEILAVADGVVESAVDQFSEPTVPITLDNEAGNYVAIQIGDRFAFYEHLRPGSIRVKVGDHVHSGDVIAQLGASGSVSSGPHLHFHISDGKSPLGAEGYPFVFSQFDVLGTFQSLEAFAEGRPWEVRGAIGRHRMEMPIQQAVVRF
jgi:hypothetical protein